MVNHRRVHRVRRVLQGPLDHTVKRHSWLDSHHKYNTVGLPMRIHRQIKWARWMKKFRNFLIRNNPE